MKRQLLLCFLVSISLVALGACKAEPAAFPAVLPSGQTPSGPTTATARLRVMTYNVNFGIGGDPSTLDAVAVGDADIVLLQETTEEWEQAFAQRFDSEYPHMAFEHCCRAGGLGYLSRHPVTEAEYLEKVDWFPAWRLVFSTPIGPLQILNVHLRPQISEGGSVVSGYFSTPPIREREIRKFATSLDPAIPTLIVGDFNENDGGRAIAYLAERGYRVPELRGYDQTWRWNTSVGTITSHLDHVVHDPRLNPVDVRVIQAGRSDHLPVLAIFELR